jgi:hypothetical protein
MLLRSSTKQKLVKSPLGRVVLHGLCLFRGGRLRWHLTGMVRELKNGAVRRDN